MGDRGQRRVARIVTYGVVLALAAAVVTDTEHWPFSAMRLFSGERTATKTGWEVDLVDEDGVEHRLDLAALGPDHAQLHYYSRYLHSLSDARVDAICTAWADAARDRGEVRAVAVHVYHLRRTVPDRPGEPSELLDRRLRFECAGASR